MEISLHDWIYSNYPPNSGINGRYGVVHIGVILLCIALVVAIACLHKKSERTKITVYRTLAFFILLFEISRRVINFTRGGDISMDTALYYLMPRPWCAISCWLTIAASLVNKKALYNYSTICSLLCALVFFAYPVVGFHHKVYLFENVYSVGTHALLLVTSLSAITLGLSDFRYVRTKNSGAWWELLLLVLTFAYAFFEVFALQIEPDPMYFLANNDVQKVLGVTYPLYLVIYAAFLVLYFNAFYIVQYLVQRKRKTPAINP
jgi:hypothetical protein